MVYTLGVHHFSGYWNFYSGSETIMNKKGLKIFFFVFTAPFALLGAYGILMACYVGFTYDESITIKLGTEFTSPDSSKKAVLYTASGGGAAGWIHHSVAIINAGDSLNESIFRSDKTVFSKRCCDSIDVNWENDSTLQIRYKKEDEYAVYKIVEKGNGVNIKYDTMLP